MALTPPSRPERTAQAQRFRAALEAISPRGARAVRLRCIDGKSRDDCASFFGISRRAFDVMLLRGSRELSANLHRTSVHQTGNAREEYREAEQLAASFDEHAPVPAELEALHSMLDGLATLSDDVRAQDTQALLDEELSAPGRRRVLLWRALLFAILAAALFFYFRPRPAPQVLRRVPAEELR